MSNRLESPSAKSLLGAGSSLVALTLLSGCVSAPVRTNAVSSPTVSTARTYVYPAQGQSPEQLDRDRYECYHSAVQQTGFDPSRPTPSYQEVVVAPVPGTGTATGAVGGAILGSILAGPRAAVLGLCLAARGYSMG